MNKKTWEECTNEEKSKLLKYWFCYYGGEIIDFDIFDKFNQLVKIYQEEIFDHIVTICIFRNNTRSHYLLESIKDNREEELFKKCNFNKEELNDDFRKLYNKMRNRLFLEIESSYNNFNSEERLIIAPQKIKRKTK